jgi:murein DD-endopeptidase MepM/ murein hydrolase activator NlpD
MTPFSVMVHTLSAVHTYGVSLKSTRILVDQKKRSHKASHTAIGVAICFALVQPLSLHAGVLSSFTDKFRSIFIDSTDSSEENEQVLLTSQTMALFKPTVVDSATTGDAEEMVDLNQDSLQAVSGPLRISTEDIDFPTSDTISVYEVKKGDTLQTVAKLFGVSVNTIMWANNLTSRTISKGDTLIILPITGIKHLVKKGDTLATIAKKYKADVQDIAMYNGLSSDAVLALGDTVIVPDGEIEAISSPSKPKTRPRGTSKLLDSYANSTPTGFLIRPLVGGRKSQGLHGHNGIDIAATPGTPVLAAASGRVIVAKLGGYNGGYGNMIIITHDNGVQTVYGHLRDIYISQGSTVNQGQTIGEVGNTGKSTGPHLHFEVRGAKNPF